MGEVQDSPVFMEVDMDKLKSAEEWLAEPEYEGITIYDPDGWDRRGEYWEASWNEKITKQEFERRMVESTCLMPRRLLDLD